MKALILSFLLFGLIGCNSPIGGDTDEHGCRPDYQWCESRQECVRPWETFCRELQDQYTAERMEEEAIRIADDYARKSVAFNEHNGRGLVIEEVIRER